MEHIKIRTQDDMMVNIMRFTALQQIAVEHFVAIEEKLTEIFELEMSTQYKERFTANAKEKRRLDKLMKEDISKFKTRFKAYKKKNYDLLSHFDTFKHQDKKNLESAVEQLYDYVDKLIIKE